MADASHAELVGDREARARFGEAMEHVTCDLRRLARRGDVDFDLQRDGPERVPSVPVLAVRDARLSIESDDRHVQRVFPDVDLQ